VTTMPDGRPVDLDLLADYAEGLLEPQRAAEVERILVDEPSWSATLASLRAAQPRLDRELSGYAEATPSMPAALADALAARWPVPEAAANSDDAADDSGRERPGGTVVSLADARRRRSVPRWLPYAAVFVLVVAGLGIGASVIYRNGSDSGRALSSAGSAAKAPMAVPMRTGLRVEASGRNYTKLSPAVPGPMHAGTVRSPDAEGATSPSSPGGTSPGGPDPASVPAALRPLLPPVALEACLGAVSASVRAVPLTVDYATYRGAPALVITLAGDHVVAAGPACRVGDPDLLGHS